MNATIIISSTVVLCIVSFWLLVKDCKKNIDNFDLKNKIFLIYSAIMIVVTIGASLLFAFLYTDNALLYSMKRVALLAVMWPVAYTDKMTFRIPNTFIVYGFICRGLILIAELFTYGWDIWRTLLFEVIAS